MKEAIYILFILLSVKCSCQNPSFTEYLKEFKYKDMPIIIDRKTYGILFCSNNGYKEIPPEYVKNYICRDTMNCESNPMYFRYDYGIQIKLSDDYNTVLVHKQKFEGESLYDFDLSETILISYDSCGKLISKKSIGKDNDGWISSIEITNKSIKTKQIKITDSVKTEMKCEITNNEYRLTGSGKIEVITTSPISEGVVIWDKNLNDYVLKQNVVL